MMYVLLWSIAATAVADLLMCLWYPCRMLIIMNTNCQKTLRTRRLMKMKRSTLRMNSFMVIYSPKSIRNRKGPNQTKSPVMVRGMPHLMRWQVMRNGLTKKIGVMLEGRVSRMFKIM